MPDQALLQIIKRTFEEISAKRNAAVLSLEGLRNTYRNTAANYGTPKRGAIQRNRPKLPLDVNWTN